MATHPTPDRPPAGLLRYEPLHLCHVLPGDIALLALQHCVDPSIFVFEPVVLRNAWLLSAPLVGCAICK